MSFAAALSLAAQTQPSARSDSSTSLLNALNLTPSQLTILAQTNRLYTRYVIQLDGRMSEILSNLHFSPDQVSQRIASTCGELANFATQVWKRDVAIFSVDQKLKLESLDRSTASSHERVTALLTDSDGFATMAPNISRLCRSGQ